MSGEQTHTTSKEPPGHNRAVAPSPLAAWVAQHRRELRGMLRNMIARRCSDTQNPGEIADDLLSELAVELLKSEDRYDPARSQQAWAMGFAANVVRRWQERDARQTQREIIPAYTSADSGQATTDLCEWLSVASRDDVEGSVLADPWVRDVLDRLNAEERAVIIALVLERRPAVEVAAEWGISSGTLNVRKCRALKRLRDVVSEEERYLSGRAGGRAGTGVVG